MRDAGDSPGLPAFLRSDPSPGYAQIMHGINVTIQLPAELMQLVEAIKLWSQVVSVGIAVLILDRIIGSRK